MIEILLFSFYCMCILSKHECVNTRCNALIDGIHNGETKLKKYWIEIQRHNRCKNINPGLE